FFFSSRRRHTRSYGNWSSDVCSSDLGNPADMTSFYVVADYQTAASRVFTRSDAALFVAGALGWPWRASQLIRLMPHAVRDRAYRSEERRVGKECRSRGAASS